MSKVNNTNMFNIQLVSVAKNCKTILISNDKKILESNVLIYLICKDVKMKLIQGRTVIV